MRERYLVGFPSAQLTRERSLKTGSKVPSLLSLNQLEETAALLQSDINLPSIASRIFL